MQIEVRCYAYGADNDWQAICVDLDISVDGDSLREARDSLISCIELYLKRVAELPENQPKQHLTRISPWQVRWKLACKAWLSSIVSRSAFQEFTIPSHFPALS